MLQVKREAETPVNLAVLDPTRLAVSLQPSDCGDGAIKGRKRKEPPLGFSQATSDAAPPHTVVDLDRVGSIDSGFDDGGSPESPCGACDYPGKWRELLFGLQ